MKKTLHIAAAQVPVTCGELNENLNRMEGLVNTASCLGVEMLLFAEAVVHAYDLHPESLRLAEPTDGPACSRLKEMAMNTGITLLAGFFEQAPEGVYNSLAAFHPDGRIEVQRKMNLTEAEQKVGLQAGTGDRTLFSVKGWSIAPVICADAAIPGLSEDLKSRGANLLALATGGGGCRADMLSENELASQEGRARYGKDRETVFISNAFCPILEEAGCGFISANLVGPTGRGEIHRGHCMIVDQQRVVRAQLPGTNILEHQQAGLITAILNPPNL